MNQGGSNYITLHGIRSGRIRSDQMQWDWIRMDQMQMIIIRKAAGYRKVGAYRPRPP